MSLLDTVVNAWTGNLSQSQRDAIVAQGQKDIAKASAGADPAVIKARQAQLANEIDGFLLKTDQGPKGTGQGTGLRLPGLGVVGSPDFLAKLNTIVKVGLGVFVVGFILWGAGKLGILKSRALRGTGGL